MHTATTQLQKNGHGGAREVRATALLAREKVVVGEYLVTTGKSGSLMRLPHLTYRESDG